MTQAATMTFCFFQISIPDSDRGCKRNQGKPACCFTTHVVEHVAVEHTSVTSYIRIPFERRSLLRNDSIG